MGLLWIPAGFLMIILMVQPAQVLAESALQVIERQVHRVLEVVDDSSMKDRMEKEAKIQSIVDEIFDYTELSKRTLAVHWNSFRPDQREEFIDLFGKLLRRIYMDRILAHTNEKVVFGKEVKLSENRVEVESQLVMPSRSIPIGYRMIFQQNQWRVYDVVIEGVSLVQNYRSQFRGILARENPEALLRLLRQRVS